MDGDNRNALHELTRWNPVQFAARFYIGHVAPQTGAVQLAALFALIAHGYLAFNQTFAGDDWQSLQVDGFQYEWVVRIGRWMQHIIWRVFAGNRLALPFSLFFMLACFLLGMLQACHVIGLKRKTSIFASLSLFVVFPFWAETVNFKMMHATTGIGVGLSLASGALAWAAIDSFIADGQTRRTLVKVFVASVLAALAVACYQGNIVIVFMVAALAELAKLFDRGNIEPRRFVTMSAGAATFFLVVLVLYGISVAVSMRISDVSAPGGQYGMVSSLVSDLEELRMTVSRSGRFLFQFLFRGQHLFPQFCKVLFLLTTIILFIGFVGKRSAKGEGHRSAIALFGALVVMLVVAPWLLGSIRVPGNSYRYNAIASTALTYAGLYGLALEKVRFPLAKGIIQLFAVGTVVVFTVQHNVAATATANLNRRDFSVATRILERVEGHENYELIVEKAAVPVLIVGRIPQEFKRPFSAKPAPAPMKSSIVECGVLDCQAGRLIALFRYLQLPYLEYRLVADVEHLPDSVQEATRDALDSMRPWPDRRSVEVTREGVVVVLLSREAP